MTRCLFVVAALCIAFVYYIVYYIGTISRINAMTEGMNSLMYALTGRDASVQHIPEESTVYYEPPAEVKQEKVVDFY